MATVNVNSITINSTSGNEGHGPFSGNNSIVSVDLQYAPWTNNNMFRSFSGCTNLTSVIGINNNITTLEFGFDGCANLVNAPVIPNSVTNMSETFFECWNLVNAPVIPNSVTNLSGTFAWCANLVNAPVIPNSVTQMGGTFWECRNLVTAPVIPNSVTNMYATFDGCSNLSGNIYIYTENLATNSYSCFSGTNALLQKNVYIPFKYANNVNTKTYNSFINAGYDTIGSYGVWLKDIATL